MRIPYRRWRDIAGGRADIEAALRLDPHSTAARLARASLDEATGRYHRALRTLDGLLAGRFAQPDPSQAVWRAEILARRGIVYSRLRQPDPARRDFAAARAAFHSSDHLAALCWLEAIGGADSRPARETCMAALQHRPHAAAPLIANATALLRLGRCRAAIRGYDEVLRLMPSVSWAPYGRGVCERRLGQMRRGSLDIRIANIDSSRIAGSFAQYGLSPGAASAAAAGA